MRVAGLAAAAHTCHAMAMIKLKTAFRHCTIGLRGSAYSGGLLAPSGGQAGLLVGGRGEKGSVWLVTTVLWYSFE